MVWSIHFYCIGATEIEVSPSIGLDEGIMDGVLGDVLQLGDLLDSEGVSAAVRSGAVRMSVAHLPFLSVS
jgi:hypothetical protein